MRSTLHRTIIILGALLTTSFESANASDLYYATGNSVYKTDTKEIDLRGFGQFIPLALTLDNAMGLTSDPDKSIVLFSPLTRSIERVPLSTVLPKSLMQMLDRNTLTIDKGKLCLATGTPQKVKDYSPEASNGIYSITSIASHDLVCLLSLPKDSFPGSVCVVTDTKTGKDLANFRLKDIYANEVDGMTWVSDKDVLCIIYSRRGNSCFLIDTQAKSSSWKEVDDAQFFSAAGNTVTLYYKGTNGSMVPKVLTFP